MLADYLPIYRLRLRTERLELRLPDLDDLAALADRAAAGIHDSDFMPFSTPWTDAEPVERGRASILWQLRVIGTSTPEKWSLPFVAVLDGRVIGMQEVFAERIALTREAVTGSWLGREHQGRGLGTEMRAAVLDFIFTGLDAEYAVSASLDGNGPSAGVSRKLGYKADGISHEVVRGVRRQKHRWRLTRADWEAHRKHAVEIEGLDDDVRVMLGLTPAQA